MSYSIDRMEILQIPGVLNLRLWRDDLRCYFQVSYSKGSYSEVTY